MLSEPISFTVAVSMQLPQPFYLAHGMQMLKETAQETFRIKRKTENFHSYIRKYTN
jgi:hypothetical protein